MNRERQRARALELVSAARDHSISDDRLGEIIYELKSVIPHPAWGDLLFNDDPRLSDEEAVEEALRHRPIAL